MKVLIFSDVCFSDNVLPLYKAHLENGVDVTCLFNMTNTHIALFNISNRIPKQAIVHATDYSELKCYEKYVDLSRVYIVNHKIDKRHAWRDIKSAVDVFNFIRQGEFDVIHCDFCFLKFKILLYTFYKKIVFIQHDPFPHSGSKYSLESKFSLWLTHRLVPKIVILNKSQYDLFCRQFKLSRNRVFVNAMGVFECVRLFKSDSIKVKKNNILFFGRIAEYKGIEYLCEAMLKIHDFIPDATLTIAGAGKFYFAVELYKDKQYINIMNRHIEEEELTQLIQQCELTVCPYTDATQSGAVLTSFALGKPVVASSINTLKEMLDDGVNSVLVAPKNPEALADAILDLLANRHKLNTLSKNIDTEYKYGLHSWRVISKKYLDIYNL